MSETLNFIADLMSCEAATVSFTVAGLAITVSVAIESKSKLKKAGSWLKKNITALFSRK